MTTWIALLRGINVGGANVLKMKALVDTFEDAGFTSVRSYIQSGNLAFSSALDQREAVADSIGRAVEERHGFRPAVLILTPAELARIAADNPFASAAAAAPATLHVYFLDRIPERPDLEALTGLASATERFELQGAVLYLDAPDGIGRSRFARQAERALGVPATARNWRTVMKMLELSSDPPKA